LRKHICIYGYIHENKNEQETTENEEKLEHGVEYIYRESL